MQVRRLIFCSRRHFVLAVSLTCIDALSLSLLPWHFTELVNAMGY